MSTSSPIIGGRLSGLQAAMVIARRDFTAILFSRSFFFFLLGPLFPVIVVIAASSVGQKTKDAAYRPVLGVAMSAADNDALLKARGALATRLDKAMPELSVIRKVPDGSAASGQSELASAQGKYVAVVTGSLAQPVLTGPQDQVQNWSGPISVLAADAQGRGPKAYPQVTTRAIATPAVNDRAGRMRTAQNSQTLLFLLTMLLAGMVLSNLVEEKANKIIEVLAAAVPMDAVFYGKLFAMLGVSFVGITVWGTTAGLATIGGWSDLNFTAPAVGWPAFIALGIAYFAMAYLVLGAVFLTIGSMAATVREVQTLSMPASMSQLVTFFFASYASARPGSTLAFVAEAIPFSSPFAMIARGANQPELWPHLVALAWQALWVAVFVRFGAELFRRRVMKSGPVAVKPKRRKLFARAARA